MIQQHLALQIYFNPEKSFFVMSTENANVSLTSSQPISAQ